MQESIFYRASELKSKIETLEYEIKVIEEYKKKHSPIRFGNNFNVSTPINVDAETYEDLLNLLQKQKKEELTIVKRTFELL